MAASIIKTFAQTVSNGLRRRSIVDCYNWATKCRIMGKPFPGPYDKKYFPWAVEMHNYEGDWCCKKAAQVGITEVALNRTFYTIDIKRVDCLYLLPSQTPDASNFSAGRFDPALEMSSYLSDLFSDVMNVGHKRAGSTNLYIRGTRSRSQLKSIPAGLIVFDELDEMTQKNLSLAEERQAGQMYHQMIKLSTPTIHGTGIAIEYNNSTKEHFFFKCPSCSRLTELIYPECFVLCGESYHDPRTAESYIQCKECKAKLHHELKHEYLSIGRFVESTKSSTHRGFHINGLYSSADLRSPQNIAEKVFKSKIDPHAEQELHNSILGEEHEVKGARITSADLENCKKDYKMKPTINQGAIITIGVDQGRQLHVIINHWLLVHNVSNTTDINLRYRPRVVDAFTLIQFEELDDVLRRWQARAMVIDANPETRKALELAYRFPGIVHLCYYGDGVKTRNITKWVNEPKITADRTAWFDLTLGRFRSGTISLPSDIPLDYLAHVKEPVRMPGLDKYGNPVARYVTGERVADHFAHAQNYAEIALPFAVSHGTTETIESPR